MARSLSTRPALRASTCTSPSCGMSLTGPPARTVSHGRSSSALSTAVNTPLGVPGRQPLAISHVGFATRQIAHLPAVDHLLQSRRLQHGADVEPGSFHRHGAHTRRLELIPQAIDFIGHRPKDLRRIPAMARWSCSLPTSMAAACGLMIGRVFMGAIGSGLRARASGTRPSRWRINLPNGNTAGAASPNNTRIAGRNQSLLQATLRVRQRVFAATLRRTL